MLLISKKEAISNNLKHYFTGKPCKNGHVTKRFVSNSACMECTLVKANEHYKNYGASDYKRNYQGCNEVLRKKSREYYWKNKEKVLSYRKVYEKSETYKKSKRYVTSKRRASKLNATPKWANLKKIKEIYRDCPKGMHVDHIIPLQGENVCGLHVENNLQYLTASDNISKGNKF